MGPPALPRAAREIDRHQPFRLRAQALLHQSDGRTKVRASGRVAGLASVRLTLSRYHVDLPKSTTACRASIGAARGMGSSLKNVKPQSSMSVPVAMSDRACCRAGEQ